MSTATWTPGRVYSAMIVADNGPDTGITRVLDAQWPTPEAAAEHIERRWLEISDDWAFGEMRMRAAVVPTDTEVRWVYDQRGKIMPRDQIVKRWDLARQANLHDDGTVSWRPKPEPTGRTPSRGLTVVLDQVEHAILERRANGETAPAAPNTPRRESIDATGAARKSA